MTPVFCSGCGELLFSYDENTIGKNYLGKVSHACTPTTHATTKIQKWFGKEIER